MTGTPSPLSGVCWLVPQLRVCLTGLCPDCSVLWGPRQSTHMACRQLGLRTGQAGRGGGKGEPAL